MESQLLLPAFYLPPVSYFHAIKETGVTLMLDRFEHYAKQTYRTRAKIGTANGILELFVPIEHGRKEHVAMKDVRISYEFDWQRLHWMSLQTAYRSSSFFEFYEDDFAVFYNQKHSFLFDFNIQQLELILKCLKFNRTLNFTESYHEVAGDIDLRHAIHPKKQSIWTEHTPYYQVFEDKTGFIADLSIVDLLFNQGPQSKSYL